MRRRFTFALFASSLALTTHLYAAPSARLVYSRGPGAESCADKDAVRAAVAARLGYDPFVAYSPATMFVEISRSGSSFRARIKLVDADDMVRGERELVEPGPSCAGLIDVMALSVSIAIDPYSLGHPRKEGPPSGSVEAPSDGAAPSSSKPEEQHPNTEHAEPVARAEAPSPASPPLPSPSPGVTWHAGAGLSAWIGAAPGPNVGARVFIQPRYERASLALEGRFDLPGSKDLPSATVRTSIVAASLVPCLHVVAWLAGCGVISAGSVHATSEGLAHPSTSSALLLALGVRAVAEVPLTKAFAAWGSLEGIAPLEVERITVGGNVVYTLPSVGAAASIGVGMRFF
jgi:hypothetical protein